MKQIFLKIKSSLLHYKAYRSYTLNGKTFKKKVMFYGYVQMNLGDDLFFETLFNRYPDTLFIAYGNIFYKDFYEKFGNVKFYNQDDTFVSRINRLGNKLKINDLFEILLIKTCDAVVHIGGSIYQQFENYMDDYNLRKRRIKRNRPYFSISSNFGAYYSKDFYDLWRKQFNKSYDICFRDKYSFELFKSVKSVRHSPDLLFSYKPENDVKEIKNLISISVINPYFSARKFSGKVATRYRETVKDTVISLVKDGKTVNLLGFCDFEKDCDFIEDIINALPTDILEKVNVINYNFGTKNKIIDALNSSECIIGTRLHSIILGLNFNKKVIPVIYNQKIKNILEDIAFDGFTADINDLDVFNAENILNAVNNQKRFDTKELKIIAENQFLMLDKFLGK